MSNIIEKLIDNCNVVIDNAEEDWGKNYWSTVLVILLRQMRAEKAILH